MSDPITMQVEMDRDAYLRLRAYGVLADMKPESVLMAALEAWIDVFEAALTPELRQEVQGIVARTYGSPAATR